MIVINILQLMVYYVSMMGLFTDKIKNSHCSKTRPADIPDEKVGTP